MSGTSGVETLSIIKSMLDPTGYVAGAQKIQQANTQLATSGEKVAAGQEKITRGMDQSARQAAVAVALYALADFRAALRALAGTSEARP